MKKIIKQTIRGIGNLPYVGEHPGTPVFILMIFTGILAGCGRGNIYLGLFGGLVMILFFGPLYLYGAYDRANISDSVIKRRIK